MRQMYTAMQRRSYCRHKWQFIGDDNAGPNVDKHDIRMNRMKIEVQMVIYMNMRMQ